MSNFFLQAFKFTTEGVVKCLEDLAVLADADQADRGQEDLADREALDLAGVVLGLVAHRPGVVLVGHHLEAVSAVHMDPVLALVALVGRTVTWA